MTPLGGGSSPENEGHWAAGVDPDRQPVPRMRSSIACVRCRASKVKCINGGIHTVCRACETASRECTYPLPALPGQAAAAKRDAAAALGHDSLPRASTQKRPRVKKTATGTSAFQVPAEDKWRSWNDALGSSILTPKVWNEVFDIFQLHFSTDLPFLHPPTFLKPLRHPGVTQPKVESSDEQSSPQPPASPILLLALLTLTARFHAELAIHHSPPSPARPTDPLAASEYYAAALRMIMAGESGEHFAQPSMERIQALLMLGLHEWGMCRGVRAWIYVGLAVRMAQAYGLEFENDLDDEPSALSSALSSEASHMGIDPYRRGSWTVKPLSGDSFVDQEMKRRTFWSCFILDRYLSSGKYRPQMVNVRDLRIQLPSSERAFLFGERVRTRTLNEEIDGQYEKAKSRAHRPGGPVILQRADDVGPAHLDYRDLDKNDEIKGRWEIGEEQGLLSRVVKAVELWGRVAKWSCAGGRRIEKYPPWDGRTTFYTLRVLLEQFHADLPRQMTYTAVNLSAHITSRTSSPYTLMHVTYFLCLILLHREYVPFIPLRLSKPEGPLDPPIFSPDEYEIPSGWWDESARICFKSARNIMEIARTCQDWDVLVETPMIGFAIYTVSFVGVYCMNFPYMDPDGFMCNKTISSTDSDSSNPASTDTRGSEEARRAIELVGQMRKRLKMADGWFRTIKRMHAYFSKMKSDYHRNTKALASSASESDGSPAAQRHLSLREGGMGGGLQEYKLMEQSLEFGSLDGEDSGKVADTFGTKKTEFEETITASDLRGSVVKSETQEFADTASGSEASISKRDKWIAINSVVTVEAARQAQESNRSHSSVEPISAPIITAYSPPMVSPTSYQQHRPEQLPATQTFYNLHSTALGGDPSPPSVPSLISPASQSASTPLSSPYPRQDSASSLTPYGSFVPQNSYIPMQQQHHHHHHQYTSTQPGPPSDHLYHDREVVGLQSHPAGIMQSSPSGQAWQSGQPKEDWLNSTSTRLGGDDVAAFVAGTKWEDWNVNGAQGAGWWNSLWGRMPDTGV